jgi:hypothetical protein
MSGTSRSSIVAVSAEISASPKACYDTIADYREGHPRIVPPKYFGAIVVERGGVGAGTRISCSITLLGKKVPFTSEIAEPVPGRVLTETIEESGGLTTFTVVDNGHGNARVTIETRTPRATGLRGIIERWVTRKYFPAIYREELARLAEVVGGSVLGSPEVELNL